MKLPRVRFTVRRMMVAVAIVSLLMAGFVEVPRLARRREDFWGRTRIFSFGEQEELEIVRRAPRILRGLKDTPEDRERRALLETRIRLARLRLPYLQAMTRKYERAARYPWLPVEPDPPEPK